MKRLMRRAILRSITDSGSKSLTSAAMRTSKPVASKREIGADAALSGNQVAPERGLVVADRRDGAEPGDDGAARQVRAGQVVVLLGVRADCIEGLDTPVCRGPYSTNQLINQ